MACLCTDLLDDLKSKFDLILELAQTVLDLIKARGGGGGGGVGGGGWPIRRLRFTEDDMLLIMAVIKMVTSDILDGE